MQYRILNMQICTRQKSVYRAIINTQDNIESTTLGDIWES